MRSIFSSLLCLCLLMGTASFAYSQNKNEESNYNLPPGYKLNPKKSIIDLSFKLAESDVDNNFKENHFKFLKELDDSEMQEAPLEYQQYINDGNEFIESLSSKVKNIYTETELWYIYAFDQKLKIRLTQIK